MSSIAPATQEIISQGMSLNFNDVKQHVINNLFYKSAIGGTPFLRLTNAVEYFYNSTDKNGVPLIKRFTKEHDCFLHPENEGYVPDELYTKPDVNNDPKSANLFKMFLAVLLCSNDEDKLTYFKNLSDATDVQHLPASAPHWKAVFKGANLHEDTEECDADEFSEDCATMMGRINTPKLEYGTQRVVYFYDNQPAPIRLLADLCVRGETALSRVKVPAEYLDPEVRAFGLTTNSGIEYNMVSYSSEATFFGASEVSPALSAFRADLTLDGKAYAFHLLLKDE